MSGARYYAALGILAAAAVVLGFRGALDPMSEHRITPIAIPLNRFPMTIAGWTGHDVPLSEKELEFIAPNDYLRRIYRRGDEAVNLFISYHGNKLEGLKRVHHTPTICLPAAGWKDEQETWNRSEAIVFNDIAKSVPVTSRYFTQPLGGDYLVTFFFSVDGVLEPIHRRPKQEPFRRLIDRLTESWKGAGYCVQVQVGTVPGGDPTRGYEVTKGFLKDTIAEIFRHFPARVE